MNSMNSTNSTYNFFIIRHTKFMINKLQEVTMNHRLLLPLANKKEYYEIRLESIGGLGANLCGKMLGELGSLYLDFNSSNFSSYGSEKRGSPVKSYIRWCKKEKELRINSPIVTPDLLVIFHEALIGKYPVLNGIMPTTHIVLNTSLSTEEAAKKYQITSGILHCIDALSKAIEYNSRVNMILLGALVKASGFIPLSACESLCSDTLGKKYPSQLTANLAGLRAGYHDLSAPLSQKEEHKQIKFTQNDAIQSAHSAPIGGINNCPGSMVSNDLSPSREGYIPLFIQERCINCGLCDSTCPDYVFQFIEGTYRGKEWMINSGLDYYHCKGCLRCVEICPTKALVSANERDYPDKPWFVPNKDLLPEQINYDQEGADPYITSESYLTEKRVDGGLV